MTIPSPEREPLVAGLSRPTRVEPPSGWKVAAVLLGILTLGAVCVIGLAVAYAWYIDIRSLR